MYFKKQILHIIKFLMNWTIFGEIIRGYLKLVSIHIGSSIFGKRPENTYPFIARGCVLAEEAASTVELIKS